MHNTNEKINSLAISKTPWVKGLIVADTASSHEGKHRKWTANNINSTGSSKQTKPWTEQQGKVNCCPVTNQIKHTAHMHIRR